MCKSTASALVFTAAAIAALIGLTACRKQPAESEAARTKSSKPAEVSASTKAADHETPSADVVAKLAKADVLDGAADHVVSKCGICALRMAGSDAHVSKLGDYELHFCSDGCKKTFDQNPSKAVMAFNVGD